MSGFMIDYNILPSGMNYDFDAGVLSLSKMRENGYEKNSLTSIPSFKNVSLNDFRPLNLSSLRSQLKFQKHQKMRREKL